MDAATQREGRVFVSSTCLDLIDLRAALKATLEECGLTPVLSDILDSDFRIDGRSGAMAVCLQNLEQSECVVCVLSQRYGSPFSHDGSEPLSATHHEIRRALELEKPVLFYVRDRLLAEMEELQRNEHYEPRWSVKEDLDGLLKLRSEIDAHPRFAGQTWLWTFRDAQELCGRVITDLGAISSAARLRQLAKARELPCVTVRCRHQPNADYTEMSITNLGPGPLSNLACWHESWHSPTSLPPGGTFKTRWKPMRDIPNSRWIGAVPAFSFDYTLRSGDRLRESYAIYARSNSTIATVHMGTEITAHASPHGKAKLRPAPDGGQFESKDVDDRIKSLGLFP